MTGKMSNALQLQSLVRRSAAGNDWKSSSFRLQTVVDVTPMTYQDFNASGSAGAIAWGSGNIEGARLNSGNLSVIGNLAVETSVRADVSRGVLISGNGTNNTLEFAAAYDSTYGTVSHIGAFNGNNTIKNGFVLERIWWKRWDKHDQSSGSFRRQCFVDSCMEMPDCPPHADQVGGNVPVS